MKYFHDYSCIEMNKGRIHLSIASMSVLKNYYNAAINLDSDFGGIV